MGKRIMMLSDQIIGSTGFGTVTRDLGIRLNKLPEYDITNISWNYRGQPITEVRLRDGFHIDFPILPGGKANYAADLLQPYFNQVKPHLFYVLLDSFMLYPWMINMDFHGAKSVLYFPTDGSFFPKDCERVLARFDRTVAMARHGIRQMKWLYENGHIKVPVHQKMVHIPHGVVETHFYPFTPDKKLQARRSFGIPDNAFVVGVVARNQGRKFLDRTMKTFARLVWGDKDNKPINNIYLFMHSDPTDAAAPANLRNLAERYKIQHRVIWSGLNFLIGFTMERMKDVYNAMDIHFLSTSGEGFGVPTIEAMACGVPSVITDYTSSAELIMENGQVGETVKLLGVPAVDYSKEINFDDYAKVYAPTHEENLQGLTGTWDVERGICDTEDAAAKIRKLYFDRELLNKYALAGREKVLKYYSWDRVVAPMWEKLLKEMLQ